MKDIKRVSRSVYQSTVEENKRLLKDIKILVEDGFPSVEKITTTAKWRKYFKDKKEFDDILKALANKYIRHNKDGLPEWLTKLTKQ